MVVINAQHPLFEERKGDLWYQLETAAREVTGRIEGIGLAEYESQVNRLLLLALGIRSRRRQARAAQPALRLLP